MKKFIPESANVSFAAILNAIKAALCLPITSIGWSRFCKVRPTPLRFISSTVSWIYVDTYTQALDKHDFPSRDCSEIT